MFINGTILSNPAFKSGQKSLRYTLIISLLSVVTDDSLK